MQWEVKFEKKAAKELKKIPQKDRARILAIIPILMENPFAGKKFGGELKDSYSYRVWPYRIIYRVYKNLLLVIIIRVGHRQGVYK